MNDVEIADRVRDLAAGVTAPTVPLSSDLDRGRARERRRRRGALVGAATVVVAASAATAALAPFASDDGDRSRRDPAQAPTVTASAVEPTPTPEPTQEPTQEPTRDAEARRAARDRAVFVRNRELAVSHLDPDGVHVSAEEVRAVDSDGYRKGNGVWADSQQSLRWTEPGSDGAARVAIGVAVYDKWTDLCDVPQGLECSDLDVAGPTVTRIEPSPIGPLTYVYVRPSDGYTITLQVQDRDKEEVAGVAVDVTPQQVADTLRDPRLALPGNPPAEELSR